MERRTQEVRLIFLLIYVAILFSINWLAFGTWIPLSGSKGLWFYSAAASILLGNLLVTPFFTKPVDALSYAVFAGTGIFLVSDFENWGRIDYVAFYTSLSFIAFVLLTSLIAITLRDSNIKWCKRLSQTCMILSDYFGSPRVVFSAVFIFALVVFHRESAKEMSLLIIAWASIVIIEPDKHLWNLFYKIKIVWRKNLPLDEVGLITAYQLPRMVLIRQHEDSLTKFGTVLVYKDSHATTKVGIALNYVGRDEALLLRAIEVNVPSELRKEITKAIYKSLSNAVLCIDCFLDSVAFKDLKDMLQINELIGIVDQDTTVERLQFEVIKENDLTVGRLVEVEINGVAVFYQIIDGLTKEDIVNNKNKYGYARAVAMKIGKWNETKNKFESINWLPEINSPVYLKKASEPRLEAESVGHFPNSTFNVNIKNIHELVTHNTAILGILGIGKSMLSIELVERMISQKIKVVCIDLTNQYANELPEFINTRWSDECLSKIQDAGRIDSDKFSESPDYGGSQSNLIRAINDDLTEFLSTDCIYNLKIYNPSEFFATKQLSEPKTYKIGPGKDDWARNAALWNITPVEITSIITEELLKVVQVKGLMVDNNARVCLVFEEAHSLVPEFTSTAAEGDKKATNRTARAILQGRKFGMGCLLITQRTANVTKTILNQCNTIFAMRTFDDTGKEFLSNYIGSEYSDRLSLLEPRQAVFYGKSSSCENPILLRLNDRDNFTKSFRVKYEPPTFNQSENEEDKKDVTPHLTRTIFHTKSNPLPSSQLNDTSEDRDDLPF